MKCSVLKCLVLGAVLGAGAACGSKGDPLPPYRPIPARTEGLTATRVQGGAITLRFTVPAANADGSAPADISAIRIFALTRPAGDPAPTASDLAGGGDETRVATIPVRRPPLGGAENTATPDTPSRDPLPGDVITWDDTTEASKAYPTPMLRYYAVAGISSRNRVGTPSAVIAVPLSAVPDAPTRLTASFTETAIKLDWFGASPSTRYRIYEVRDGDVMVPALNAEPLRGTTFEDPRIEPGVERCYIVRAAVVEGSASVESTAAGPVCITPRDVFPPPVPANLTAVAATGAVNLIWDAVDAADLAGYVVLRAAKPGDKLVPLFETPIADTTYRDATTAAGTRYVYAIVAVDKTGNRSAESNRVEETGR